MALTFYYIAACHMMYSVRGENTKGVGCLWRFNDYLPMYLVSAGFFALLLIEGLLRWKRLG